MQTAGTKGS